MRCYRKILHISYKDHVTNEEVRAKIQQGTGPHKVLLTIVKRRRLQWYGHVSRSSGLAKTILQGLVITDGGSKPEMFSRIVQVSIDKVETNLEWQEYFSQFQATTDVLPCHIHLPVCLWIMDPHSRAPKNTSHGNNMLLQDTMHLIQRPCYQRGSSCQDPAGSQTTQRPPDHHKEMQTAMVWLCLPVIRSGQNHLARHSEREKKSF